MLNICEKSIYKHAHLILRSFDDDYSNWFGKNERSNKLLKKIREK